MDTEKMKEFADNSGFTAYFELTTKKINPSELLLDPRNPRLAIESDEFEAFSEQDLAKSEVQKAILGQIDKKEHHVKDLIDAIGAKGFIQGLGSFIIKKVPDTNKYIVLEGNRRTAAIKHLLQRPDALSTAVKKSIENIEVSEFHYKGNNTYTEEQIIDMLLGIIHLRGPLPWGPIEKARYVYHAYMREYRGMNGKKGFSFDPDCVAKVCAIFPLDKADIKKSLRIYRVYEQIKETGYKVNPDRFTLIEMSINDAELRDNYFEWDKDSFRFSDVGLERNFSLCIREGHPINDPATFRKFKKIFEYGAQTYLCQIEDGHKTVDEVYQEISPEITQGRLYDQLGSILEKIKKLNLRAFSEADEECLTIARDIIDVANSKLGPLINSATTCNGLDNQTPTSKPSDIQEAIRMPSSSLREIIRSAMKERPNQTCMRGRLVNYVLDYMSIVSRGEPRILFKRKLDSVLREMISDGIIQEYRATNDRLRLLL